MTSVLRKAGLAMAALALGAFLGCGEDNETSAKITGNPAPAGQSSTPPPTQQQYYQQQQKNNPYAGSGGYPGAQQKK